MAKREVPIDHAYCPDCKKTKHYTEFRSNTSRPNGLSAYCTLCSRSRANKANKTKRPAILTSELRKVQAALTYLKTREIELETRRAEILQQISEAKRAEADAALVRIAKAHIEAEAMLSDEAFRSPEAYARRLMAAQFGRSLPADLLRAKADQIDISRLSRALKTASENPAGPQS